MSVTFRNLAKIAILFLTGFLSVRYILPLIFPFLAGALLALAAEPLVRFLTDRCRMRRGLAAGIGVGMTFCLLTLLLLTLVMLLLRELRMIAGAIPEVEESIRSGLQSLSAWAMELAGRAPESMQGMLRRSVRNFFSDGSALLDKSVDFLLRIASGILSSIPGGALTLATAVISSFMISAKLPRMKQLLAERIPMERILPVLSGIRGLKDGLLAFIKAQLRLMSVTFLVTGAGLLFLKVRYWFLWAAAVAAVDVLPVLGAGTVLVPWSFVSFLQGDSGMAFGLLGIYAVAALSRSVLEPRLVGRQLGLDPLVTLMALYIGYRLFGFAGILLSPVMAVMGVRLAENVGEKTDRQQK